VIIFLTLSCIVILKLSGKINTFLNYSCVYCSNRQHQLNTLKLRRILNVRVPEDDVWPADTIFLSLDTVQRLIIREGRFGSRHCTVHKSSFLMNTDIMLKTIYIKNNYSWEFFPQNAIYSMLSSFVILLNRKKIFRTFPISPESAAANKQHYILTRV
jgi:hypothetical protein